MTYPCKVPGCRGGTKTKTKAGLCAHHAAQERGRKAHRAGQIAEQWFEPVHTKYRNDGTAWIEKQRGGLRIIKRKGPFLQCVPAEAAPVDYIGSVGLRDKTFVTRFTPVAFDVKSSESGELDISLSEGGRGLQRHQYEYLRQHWEAFGGLSFVLLVHDDQSKGIRRCCFFAFETIKTLVEHGVKSVPFDETTALQNQSTGWDWLPALPKENP